MKLDSETYRRGKERTEKQIKPAGQLENQHNLNYHDNKYVIDTEELSLNAEQNEQFLILDQVDFQAGDFDQPAEQGQKPSSIDHVLNPRQVQTEDNIEYDFSPLPEENYIQQMAESEEESGQDRDQENER
ncbi:hypothetical protein SAMN05660653_03233 [Desulfonatronum thiosulfatophilum]|uniref:Uncharacterized protein n=2 Tax=Desulfonatronum thiosulfatophilum TaxID=617002 RepID=A0A1G6EWG9_9BACT|nr:hypothetical protein SAMN05660653_03233 [Desulfonatronum thiosulfatophilum]